MAVRIEVSEGYPDAALVDRICTIPSDQAPSPVEQFERQLKHQYRILGCYAYSGGLLVGFKIGYEPRPYYFESWLGAVDPGHRGQGIATRLMQAQHEWCARQNYRFITTITDASNSAMLILNLKAGFTICGTLLDRGTVHKVLLQKRITGGDTDDARNDDKNSL